MKWDKIKVSEDATHFIIDDKPAFKKRFHEVLKYHSPGLAPVVDLSGAYHVDINGNPIYEDRYTRTFGYYCNRAAVIENGLWFHIDDKGNRIYDISFSWTGNYQENLCAVRDLNNNYFHIDLHGQKIYPDLHIYAGDYKDGVACIKQKTGLYRHIDLIGNYINEKSFLDLGVFHKNYATAKDHRGWFHINKDGEELYENRYLSIEPYYNGYSLVTKFDSCKTIINEIGEEILRIG